MENFEEEQEKINSMNIGEIRSLKRDCEKEIMQSLLKFYEATGLRADGIVITNYNQEPGAFEPVFKVQVGHYL